ncbi:MAG: DUF429 domain-containing protein [Alicyclobacillus sp.]|nr:DUF429 domain-containing protein [Alicyclobacillus sp.]
MHFFGIDLAFSPRNPSGLFVINENGKYVTHEYQTGDQEIVQFIRRHLHAQGNVIVVDAPLVVHNDVGQRPCEKQVGTTYGGRGASCHSANTRLPSGRRGPEFVSHLKAAIPQANIAVDATAATPNFYPVIETYPHPGHIELFGLASILPYKRKPRRSKVESVSAMATYQQHLKDLADADPALLLSTSPLLNTDVFGLKGQGFKKHEDLLDSLFCAYVALYLWKHKSDPRHWKVFGDMASGFITIPTLP